MELGPALIVDGQAARAVEPGPCRCRNAAWPVASVAVRLACGSSDVRGDGVNGNRFDSLSRALARRHSRRTTVRHLALASIVGSLASVGSHAFVLAFPARQAECPPTYPWLDCDGFCVNIETDPNHCGNCGVACYPGESCSAGSCTQCGGTLAPCGESCVDLQSDHDNCGGCGVLCQNWENCVAGLCFADPTEPGGSESCPSWLTYCDGFCVDTQRDDENCGGCRSRCQPLVMECREGRCVVVEDPCFPSVC
jgi:hypothetical protein